MTNPLLEAYEGVKTDEIADTIRAVVNEKFATTPSQQEELIRLRALAQSNQDWTNHWRELYLERGDYYAQYVEFRERYKITKEVMEENRDLKAQLRAVSLCRDEWMQQAARSEQSLFLAKQQAKVPGRFGLFGWLVASGLAGWIAAVLWTGV